MADIRKLAVIAVIGILFAIFSYTFIDALFPEPRYNDFCDDTILPKPMIEDRATEPDPYVQCNTEYREAANTYRETIKIYVFIVGAVLGILAVLGGMLLPGQKKEIHSWIGSGFMVGGLITIFMTTSMSFDSFGPVLKPIIIALELVLVIWLAYRQFGQK